MRQIHRAAARTGRSEAGTGFAGFVARNAAPAYRFAVMVLDNPVAAQNAVHDALMATWTAASQWPPSALDAAFGRRLVGGLRTAVKDASRLPGGAAGPAGTEADSISQSDAADDPVLAAALVRLEPDDALLLAERFGMPEHVEPVAITLRGRGSLDRRLPRALEALENRLPGGGGAAFPLADRLRAIYAARDPGDAPTQLRWRLQRSLIESEQAAAEQAEIAARSDWAFPFKTVLAILVFVLAIAVLSVARLGGSEAAANRAAETPASISIGQVSVVSAAIEGSSVHVSTASSGFFASFEAAAEWHVAPKRCRADVVGRVGWAGSPTWLGEETAHFASVVSDPRTGRLLAAGTSAYCESGLYTSDDGGRTWTRRSMPAGLTAVPDWIALDGTRPGHMLLASGAQLFVGQDDGRSWTELRLDATPLALDARGRLLAWRSGEIVESWDEGETWRTLGPAPATRPVAAAATANGVYLAAPNGLWWCRFGREPVLLKAGVAFDVKATSYGAVAAGADSTGAPWIATADASGEVAAASGSPSPGAAAAADAPLPDEVASLRITGAEVAVGPSGALVALTGPESTIVFASFAR